MNKGRIPRPTRRMATEIHEDRRTRRMRTRSDDERATIDAEFLHLDEVLDLIADPGKQRSP